MLLVYLDTGLELILSKCIDMHLDLAIDNPLLTLSDGDHRPYLELPSLSAGLMLVYCVVIGDMLVGKQGFQGLLCGSIGGIFCSRPFVVGLVTLIVLIPAVSFRYDSGCWSCLHHHP